MRSQLIFLFLLLLLPVRAQQPGDRVNSVYADAFGCVWLGTDHGLLRKCGTKWQAYPVQPGAPGMVKDLAGRTTGTGTELWVGTDQGILRINYTAKTLKTAKWYLSETTMFLSDIINGISFDKNAAAYFATPAGIGILKGEKWDYLTDVQDIIANEFTTAWAAGDTLYFGTLGEGVARLINTPDAYTGASSLMAPWSALAGNDVTCIFVDSRGYRWYGSDLGLSRHTSPESKEGWDESYTQDLPDWFVTSVVEDSQGNIWVGTHGGLVRFTEGERGNHTTWTMDNGLPSNTILDLCITGEDKLWIGTDRGAAYFDGSGSVNYKTSDYTKNFPPFNKLTKKKKK